MIHKTAIVSDKANLGKNVSVGPFAIIDDDVVIGDNCVIGPRVHIERMAIIGKNNSFSDSAVIGGPPQDDSYRDEPTYVQIGDDNKFREFVTMHRSTNVEKPTIIGNNNFLMSSAHCGHDSIVGNNTIIVSAVLLAGHTQIDDFAVLGGGSVYHQNCRVGKYSIIGGQSCIGKDVPPFVAGAPFRGNSEIHGLNTIGLKRNGFSAERIKVLKALYKVFFRDKMIMKEAIQKIKDEFEQNEDIKYFIEYIESSKRGVYR